MSTQRRKAKSPLLESDVRLSLNDLHFLIFLRSLSDDQQVALGLMLDALTTNQPNPEVEGMAFLDSLSREQLEEFEMLWKERQWARVH